MGLTKLGSYIELVNRRNTDRQYGETDVYGASNNKEIMPTKANNEGRELDKFYIVSPDEFLYNSRTTRMGEKIGLGYNDTGKSFITSWNNTAFRVKSDAQGYISPIYLFMYFNRPEFDRYSRFNSWGSSTEIFSWDDMCDIPINLPSLSIQQKYVEVYKAMVANQKAYERGLADLKLTCDAYIERLKKEVPSESIGQYIEPNEKNNSLGIAADSVMGLSTSKELISTKADLEGVELSKYKVFQPNHIAYVSDTSRRGEKISLAMNNTEKVFLLSSISTIFRTDVQKLTPEYLMLFFSRPEFDRYTRFHSWGSARETFNWEDMQAVKLPIPSIQIQKDIVNIYNAYLQRREINEKLKAQIKNICPILIKGSIEEARSN